jgi:FkbM family methyltransferase
MLLRTLPLQISRKLESMPFVHDLLREFYCLFRPGIRAAVVQAFKRSDRIRVLKIGANDGVNGDPLAALLLKDRRYMGVLVEPLPQYALPLERAYGGSGRFEVIQVAITDTDGDVEMYYFDESKAQDLDFPAWYREIASLDEEHVKKHLPTHLHHAVGVTAVLAMSVQTLARRCDWQTIDLLHIDTEGHDFRILQQFDFKVGHPRVIIAEHKHLPSSEKEAMQVLLEGAGYGVRELEADYLAVSTRQS